MRNPVITSVYFIIALANLLAA